MAAAAAVWAAAALVLAVLLALAVTVALVLVAGLAVADAASYHEPQVRPGAGSAEGARNAAAPSRSSASSGAGRRGSGLRMATNCNYSNTSWYSAART